MMWMLRLAVFLGIVLGQSWQPLEAASPETQSLPETVGAIVASEATFGITPDTVVESFADLAPLTPQAPGHVWQFFGSNEDQGVRWVRATFELEETDRTWNLSEVLIALPPLDADGKDNYDAMVEDISRRLGPPSKPDDDDPTRRVAWNLGQDKETAVLIDVLDDPLADHPPITVLVETLRYQGEPEDD